MKNQQFFAEDFQVSGDLGIVVAPVATLRRMIPADTMLTLPMPKGGDSYEELTEVSFTRKGFAKSPLATRSKSSLWLLLRNMSLSQFTECVNRKDSPNGERLISPSLKLYSSRTTFDES